MSLLDDIVASKWRELDALCAILSEQVPGAAETASALPRASLETALARGPRDPLRLCCEHKRRSPSGGAFDTTLSVGARAAAYARAGAKLVSVLTDGPYFGGAWEDVTAARDALAAVARESPCESPALVLAKEFVIDPVQVRAARRYGADAVLVIVRIVDDISLASLVETARAEGLSALVEVTSEDELERALESGARTVGVNARDLDTLTLDPARAARVLARIPSDVRAVHLSGLKAEADIVEVAEGRADAALVGERLMRERDPSALLTRFVQAASAARTR